MSTNLNNMSPEDLSQLLLDCSKGRLSDAQMLDIKQAASESDEIAAELALYQGLSRAGAQSDDSVSPAGELGWARLSRAIDQHEGAQELPVAANDNSGGLWRYASMALGFIVLGQFAFMGFGANTSDDVYQPVTPQVAAFSAQITFVETANEVAIRQLLLANDAEIIAGPSSLGIYELVFADEASRAAGLRRFSEAPEIVESAIKVE